MDRTAAIRKIKACMDRARSSTFPNEVEIALRQAQALMDKYQVDHPELLSVGVEEHWRRSRAIRRPPAYEAALAGAVGRMFGCKVVFKQMRNSDLTDIVGGYAFIGMGASSEIAVYTYTVLTRQLIKARAEYTATHLKRFSKNKIAAADQFCYGWVAAATRHVEKQAMTLDAEVAIDAFVSRAYPTLGETALTRREVANKIDHRVNGFLEGSKASVNKGVGTSKQPQAQLSF